MSNFGQLHWTLLSSAATVFASMSRPASNRQKQRRTNVSRKSIVEHWIASMVAALNASLSLTLGRTVFETADGNRWYSAKDR